MKARRFADASVSVSLYGCIVAVYACLIAYERNFTPFYDGGIYYTNIIRLLQEPFRWDFLHMEQHPSVPYTLLIAAGQWLDQGNMVLLAVTNFGLALFAAALFHRILRRLFGKAATPVELALCALLLAFAPVLVVHAFHLNLDYPAMIFFIFFLHALIVGRRRWMVILSGLLLLFTKETSLLYYAATTALYLICYVLRPSGSVKAGIAAALKRWDLFVPGVAYAAYQALYWAFVPPTLYWGYVTNIHPERELFKVFANLNLSDPGIQSYLANIFMLNFHWVLTLVIAIWMARGAGNWMTGRKTPRPSGIARADVLFCSVLLIVLAYCITRVRPWNNPRYALAAYPVLIIVAQYALVMLTRKPAIRIGILTVTLFLVMLSNFRTFDPASRAFYGTIPYGTHAWLNMTSRLGPEDVHRDMHAYNLEFLELDFMMDSALRNVHPAPGELLLTSPWMNFYLSDRIDPRTGRNTWRISDSYAIRWNDNIRDFGPDQLPSLLGKQKIFRYFAFPHLRNDESLALLREHNLLLNERQYGRHDYTMNVYTFALGLR